MQTRIAYQVVPQISAHARYAATTAFRDAALGRTCALGRCTRPSVALLVADEEPRCTSIALCSRGAAGGVWVMRAACDPPWTGPVISPVALQRASAGARVAPCAASGLRC